MSMIGQYEPGYDFDKLKQEYPDIFGWIVIPGTRVDTPLVKKEGDDFFYINHNGKQEYDLAGAAFVQHHNNTDMQDPVTLIYGHNMLDDRVFSTILKFDDPQFFKENQQIYVYTPGHKFTYLIYSAYVYDDRHIMNAFDFSKEEIRTKYFDYVMNPQSMSKNVREGIKLAPNDKIIQLSTCMNDLSLTNQRYLVTGVMTNEEVLD